MSMKYYGIYLAYAPTVDLRDQGLGRYLASFLNGASERDDVSFVIVCPSWSRDSLEQLFESEQVSKQRFEIISPKAKPVILRVYEHLYIVVNKIRSIKVTGLLLTGKKNKPAHRINSRFEGRVEKPYSPLTYISLVFDKYFWLLLITLPLSIFEGLFLILKRLVAMIKPKYKIKISRSWNYLLTKVSAVLTRPKESAFVFDLFKKMENAEVKRMLKLVNAKNDVRAWYIPTAFWPSCNQIIAPKLMCVPDVVLTDFPIAFSKLGGDRFLATFEAIESTINSAQYFVTYSEAVKWNVLVDRYSIEANNVHVVHHAPNNLNHWVTVTTHDKKEELSRAYSELLFHAALQKSTNKQYTDGFLNKSVRFIFYASQFRPNKNVIMLLKAYKHLLHNRFIGHKLILTGDPRSYPPVQAYITQHNLQNDVLCLPGLKIEELAACYKLADLAVNPSLSEGGCPFTFTEALSVNTPVVMAKIPVTEEVLSDPELQKIMFFDPYDWKSLASRVQWALEHREQLLSEELRVYTQLAKRNWTDVVNEHISILDRISTSEEETLPFSSAVATTQKQAREDCQVVTGLEETC